MTSSYKKLHGFLTALFVVLAAVCLGFACFLTACGGGGDDPEEEENEYVDPSEPSGDQGSGDAGGSSGEGFEEIENYEWIDTYADLESALAYAGGSGSSYKTTEDLTVGKFTFGKGVYFENSNSNFTNDGVYDVNTQQKDIYFTVSGEYNNISFKAVESSSKEGAITLYTAGGAALYTWTASSGASVYVDYAQDTGKYLEAGEYRIDSGGNSFRLGNICVSEYLAKSSVTGITVKAGVTDFLKGSSVAKTDLGLSATLDYENGRQDTINVSDLDVAIPSQLTVGANVVTVSYSYTDNEGNSTTYSEDITIYVYYVTDITVSDFSMEYTGGTYYTNNVQKVFMVGDAFNSDYAAVTAAASCGVEGMDTVEFILAAGEYYVAAPDLSSTGEKTVTISTNLGETEGNAKTTSYTIHVIEITSSTDRAKVNVVHPTENADGTETEVATYAADSDGVISVSTINDAIQLIKLMGAMDKERKYIYVGEGQYWEKIYIDIPNLSIIGSNPETSNGGTAGDLLATRSEVTEIIYDAMNGVMDPSGTTTYSTVGSATVTVASQATGFYAANITFRNYWNTNALYNEALKITSSTQADAAYINADKAHFYNVTFTGYHDTLEAENGRQYYDRCYIEGRTDYIFGNTATCYFYQCNIHTIGAGSSTNGGYVTAVKGGSMTYGYVFDGCNFTSDLEKYYGEGDGQIPVPYDGFAYTAEGTVSLGRTWSSSDMHVAVLNSTFDAGYSTKAYGDSSDSKNARYGSMSGYAPNPEYLVEYNNSGAGAITTDLANTCSMLTADQAASYTIENIFAANNGGINYSDDWDPTGETLLTVTVKNGSQEIVATIYVTDSISVDDLIGAINARLSDTQVAAVYSDESCTVEVSEPLTASNNSSVTVYIETEEKDMSVTKTTYWDFYNENFGSAHTASGYLDADEKLYLDIVQSDGKLERYNGKYYYMTGATLTLTVNAGSILCIGVYQENSVNVVDGSGNAVTLTTLSTGNDKTAYTYTAEETVTLTIGQGTQALYLMYINVSVGPVEENTTITFRNSTQTTMEYQGCLGWYYDIFIDATQGKFQVRSSGDAIVNDGVILYIRSTADASVTINWYTGYEGVEEGNISVDENGLIKIVVQTPSEPQNAGSRYIWDIVITMQTS